MYHSFMSLDEVRQNPLRIFDPFSYRVTLTERMVPVSISETFRLAAFFPLLWHYNHVGHLELVALRSLTLSTHEIPGIKLYSHDALPYLLQAYPFRYRNVAVGEMTIGLERTSSMQERDLGSYIFNSHGDYQVGAEQKVKSLEEFSKGIELQKKIANFLLENQLLEVVALPNGLSEKHNLPDFFATRELGDWSPVSSAFSKTELPQVMRFLASQRLSLFRAAHLIALEEQENA